MADASPQAKALANAMPQRPITDSPWLWFALFTGVGLSALLATGGKFGKRQSGIERKYQARSGVASGDVAIDTDATGAKTVRRMPAYSTPEKTVIPLWPLEILLAAVFGASLWLLLRERLGLVGATRDV